MSFYDNLRIACDNKGIKVTPFIQSLGLNSANTGAWKSGGYPRVENLIEMADALDVTTDYLLGREEEKQGDLLGGSWHGGVEEIKEDSTVLNYGESPTKYKIKELIDTVLEKTDDEEELNALKIMIEKFAK